MDLSEIIVELLRVRPRLRDVELSRRLNVSNFELHVALTDLMKSGAVCVDPSPLCRVVRPRYQLSNKV